MSHSDSASAWMFSGRVCWRLFGGPRKPMTFWPMAVPGNLPETFSPETFSRETFPPEAFSREKFSLEASSLHRSIVDEVSLQSLMFDVSDHRSYCPRIRS